MKKLLLLFISTALMISCKKDKNGEIEVSNNGATIAGLLVKEIIKTGNGAEINIEYYYDSKNRINKSVSIEFRKDGKYETKIENISDIVYNNDNTIKMYYTKYQEYSKDPSIGDFNQETYLFDFEYQNGIISKGRKKRLQAGTITNQESYTYNTSGPEILKINTTIDYPYPVKNFSQNVTYNPNGFKISIRDNIYESFSFDNTSSMYSFLIVNPSLINQHGYELMPDLFPKNISSFSSRDEFGNIINTKYVNTYNDNGLILKKTFKGSHRTLDVTDITSTYYYSK